MSSTRNDTVIMAFAERLKALRSEVNITQEELAHRSGLTLSQIARIETGRINTTICTLLTKQL